MKVNRHSSEWAALKIEINARIREHRDTLESLNIGPDETNVLRGRIAELRDLIEIVEPTPQPEAKDVNYG